MTNNARNLPTSHPIFREYPELNQFPLSPRCSDSERLDVLMRDLASASVFHCGLYWNDSEEIPMYSGDFGDKPDGGQWHNYRLNPREALDDLVARAKRDRWK